MWVRNNFASLRIVDGSGAVVRIVAGCAMKTYLHVELPQSCFFHAPVGDRFYERCDPFNNMNPLSGTDVIQTESLENFVVIFEIFPIDKEWKSSEITYCRSLGSCGFNDRNATLQVDFFLTSTTLELELFMYVLFHRTKYSNSVSFSQSQCCRLLKLLLTRF